MNSETAALANRKCVPCEGGTASFSKEEAKAFLRKVTGWILLADPKQSHPNILQNVGMRKSTVLKISKEFKFKNFKEALGFANAVGAVAGEEGHHPDLYISWGKVVITLTTHAIKGLSENDFIMAAKIDSLEMQ